MTPDIIFSGDDIHPIPLHYMFLDYRAERYATSKTFRVYILGIIIPGDDIDTNTKL